MGSGQQLDSKSMLLTQAIWHMRVPALFICGPVLGVLMIESFFGLPRHLWYLAAGFFLFSLVLFGILVRGEIRRIRRAAKPR